MAILVAWVSDICPSRDALAGESCLVPCITLQGTRIWFAMSGSVEEILS